MKPTGKNKEQFKKYYDTIEGGNYKILYQNFMAYPFEMQIGVYLAYYDSLDVKVDITSSSTEMSDGKLEVFDYELAGNGEWFGSDYFDSRNEAYKEAFKKANEIVNKEKYKKQ